MSFMLSSFLLFINGIIYYGDEPEEQLEIRNIILNEIFPIIEGVFV